mmetsp:Transcript_27187/g.69852  ORF Transcript_27187/g.69852 Transcript_27187/m.69852 type:complete len:260 (+) Transcript_27187:1304-2083(+)
MERTFFTAGGGPLDLPDGAISNVPTCVQLISSSADSNTSRVGTALMRARSHSTWSKSNSRLPKKMSAPFSAASISCRLGSRSRSLNTDSVTPGNSSDSRLAARLYRSTLKDSKPEMSTMLARRVAAPAAAPEPRRPWRSAAAARPLTYLSRQSAAASERRNVVSAASASSRSRASRLRLSVSALTTPWNSCQPRLSCASFCASSACSTAGRLRPSSRKVASSMLSKRSCTPSATAPADLSPPPSSPAGSLTASPPKVVS